MNISCTVQMLPDEELALSLNDAAAAVLEALQGDPAKDIATVTVMTPPEMGTAGSIPGMIPQPVPLEPPPPPANGG